MATPNLRVVAHKPWRRVLVALLAAVIGVACLVLGYVIGQNKVISERVSSGLLSRDLTQAESRVQEMEAELIDARLALSVQRDASDSLRVNLKDLHSRVQHLEEEVTFYKSLMAPGELPEGLQVTGLELKSVAQPRTYVFQLLLTQVARRRSFIGGEVRIDVVGAPPEGTAADSGEDGRVVLSLTELSEPKSYPLKFRFRYFQDLSGRITLPEDFVPARVLVTAKQSGKEALQVTFPWPELG